VSGEVRSLGGVPIPVDRRKLNLLFWLLGGSLVFYLVFFNDAPVPLARLGESLALVVAILLPSWLWVSNRSQGLPMFPLYALSFFPTYAVPLCRGDSRFVQYTEQEIANAVFTIVGYLLLATLVWWQCTNRNLSPPEKVRAVLPHGARQVMVWLLVGGLVFELFGRLAGEGLGGVYQALRGYAQNGSRLAVFVLFYQMGRGELSKGMTIFVCALAGALLVRQAASIVMASAFPVLGLAFAGFFLGSGRVPWKSLLSTVAIVVVLHSGKAEMRSIYYQKGVQVGLLDYPMFFADWIQKGVYGLAQGKTAEGQEVQSAKERAALMPLMLRIQKMTPTQVPYLDGASYEKLPSMLVPRIITKDKAVAHISNMIMAVHYGVLKLEDVWGTSIAFDLPMEAYANYGYLGVAGLALAMGLFLGFITLSTTGVPLLSFRFLLAILILAALISSNNTMGVYVTTAWQGFLALLTLSLLIMKTIPNPLYAKPVALRKMGDGRSPQPQRAGGWATATPSEIERAEGSSGRVAEGGRSPSTQGLGGREAPVAGPTSLQTSPTREELRRVEDEAAPAKHGRPQRFIYKKGEKRG